MPRNETILLAEDNQDDILLVQAAFANAGIRQPLQVVANGLEAIRYLGGEGKYANRTAFPFPFLLLLDLKMPLQDGFAIMEWIRARPALRRKLKLIVLTGAEDGQSRERARGLGVDSFLSKPLSFHELEEMMRRLKARWIEPKGEPATPASD